MFNPLPDDRILALSELKAFAADNFRVTQNTKFGVHRVETIVGKGENVKESRA